MLTLFASLDVASAAEQQTPAASTADGAGSGPLAQSESNWQLGVALGYGLRTNPLAQSDDIPIVIDIDIAWFGEHFFFDNGDIGLTFVDNEWMTTSIIARVNSDRVFFGKTDTEIVTVGLAGAPLAVPTELVIPDRDYAVEAGVEVLADGRWGQFQFAAHHDVSGTHDGYEVDLNYGIGFRSQRWYLEPSFGVTYKSAAMNDYYWGVRVSESNEPLPAYAAGAGLNSHAKLLFSYQINESWAFTLAGEFERLNDEAAASPIVVDRNVFGYFAGFGYRF